MKVVPPDDFLDTKGTHFFSDPSSVERETLLEGTKRTPQHTLTVSDTSSASKRRGTPRPTPSSASGRNATSFECGEFWRYFQNASQLALVVPGGGDAVIGRTEARQLLANFRGTNVESIAKTDSGLLHICGLSVRQLHDFVSGLWRVGCVGMSVIKDLIVGSTKGPAKKLLLQSQKKRMDEHIRSHCVSVHSALHAKDDGADDSTRGKLLPPPLSTKSSMLSTPGSTMPMALSTDSSFEDDVKLDKPKMPVMKTIELKFCKAEAVHKSKPKLLGVDSYGGWFNRPVKGALTSITTSLTDWVLEEDDVLSLAEDSEDDDEEYAYDDTLLQSSEETKSDHTSVDDASLSHECQWLDTATPTPCLLPRDSEEIIYLEGISPRKASLSLSLSMGERLATAMHAPIGV